MRLSRTWLPVLGALVLMGCDAGPSHPGDEYGPKVLTGGTGKGDGLGYEVLDYFRKTNDLPIDDLVLRGVSLATQELNELLSSLPYLTIKLADTTLFGATGGEVDGVPVQNIAKLRSGLIDRFGEKDFATQITDMRLFHLQSSDYALFAESEFKVDIGHKFKHTVKADDLPFSVGFSANQSVMARILFSSPNWLHAYTNAPLEAVLALRGFILPTGIDDIMKMKPGESVTLLGRGHVGFNVGANIPVFSFEPVSHLLLSSRFSISARAQVSGHVDYQLIRGEGNTVYLEVGVENRNFEEVKVALKDGFGLTALPAGIEVTILGKKYSLGKIAEKVVTNYLRKKGWSLFGAELSASGKQSRIMINRFEFDFSIMDEERAQALLQGLSGDLRLAQTLGDRPDSGVRETAGFTRDLNNRRQYAGAHIASLRFFVENIETSALVYIEDSDSMWEILLDQIEYSAGKFFTTWGFRRQLIRSQEWKSGEYLGANANLRIAVTEADRFTRRDQILDHIDSILLSLMDFDTVYHTLSPEFDKLQYLVDKQCDECLAGEDACLQIYRDCAAKTLTAEEFDLWIAGLDSQTIESISQINDEEWDPGFMTPWEVASQLLDLRKALSTSLDYTGFFADYVGRTSILTDQRFTLEGLDGLFVGTLPETLEERLAQVLTLIVSKRFEPTADMYVDALETVQDEKERLAEMGRVFDTNRTEYLKLDEMSAVTLEGESITDSALVLAPTSPGNEEDITILSLSDLKGRIAAGTFDELIDAAEHYTLMDWVSELFTLGFADPLGFESHHLVAYSLLSLIPASERELLISMDVDASFLPTVRTYSRGEGARLIEAGEFDLQKLLEE